MTAATMSSSSSSTSSSSSSSLSLSFHRRLILAGFACLQNSLVGGIVFGWASVSRTLMADDAGLSYEQSTRIFSWASSAAMMACLVLGIVLDYGGPRLASVAANIIIGTGCLFVVLSDNDIRYLTTGICLIGFGGPGIQCSVVHVANLFPRNKYLAMSCLVGTVTISFAVLAIFDIIWQVYGIGYRTLFGGFGIVVAACAWGSFLLFPDVPYEAYNEEEEEELESSSSSTMFGSSEEEEDDDDDVEQGGGKGQEPLVPAAETTSLVQHHHHRHHHHHHHRHHRERGMLGSTLAIVHETEELAATSIENNHPSTTSPEHDYVEANISHSHFIVEQPMNSYLRTSVLHKTCSFLLSEKVLKTGKPLELLCLKDQPFAVQFKSGTYFRTLVVFLITSFCANFYIASFTTEMADLQQYSLEDQQTLARSFTFIMSLGIFASVVTGYLMDCFGIEWCTVLTLFFGQLHVILFICFGGHDALLLTSFAVYTLFRQFLFPVFIAGITHRLGFKYYGVLSGIGFAMSGLFQLLMPLLTEHVQGTCHINDDDTCQSGHWTLLHWIECIVFGILMLVPLLDHLQNIQRQERLRFVLDNTSTTATEESCYGAMSDDNRQEEGPTSAE